MAEAILRGAFRAGALAPGDVVVAEPDAGRRALIGALGIAVCERSAEALARSGIGSQMLLAVKPQSLSAVGAEIGALAPSGVVISILAGGASDRVRAALGGACRVVRVMPNLPAQIGMGVSAVCLGAGSAPGDDAFARRLLAGVGEVVAIDEPLMDAFTALAGSGPAYLFYLAEAMRRAGVEMGFDEATADRVTRSVLAGSGALLAQSPERSAEAWRAAVTSKGGTTEAACRALDDAGAMAAFVGAIIAARDRGAALARE